MTFGQAVAQTMAARSEDGEKFDISVDEWLQWSSKVGYEEAREKARSLGVDVDWDCERPRTPEGC